jgi:hypothetical protein
MRATGPPDKSLQVPQLTTTWPVAARRGIPILVALEGGAEKSDHLLLVEFIQQNYLRVVDSIGFAAQLNYLQ